MASGTDQEGGWSDLMVWLNDQFSTSAKRVAFKGRFIGAHGPTGAGDSTARPPLVPYKFGRFVDRGSLLPNEKLRAKFMIDSGTNRWEKDALVLLEYVIKHS